MNHQTAESGPELDHKVSHTPHLFKDILGYTLKPPILANVIVIGAILGYCRAKGWLPLGILILLYGGLYTQQLLIRIAQGNESPSLLPGLGPGTPGLLCRWAVALIFSLLPIVLTVMIFNRLWPLKGLEGGPGFSLPLTQAFAQAEDSRPIPRRPQRLEDLEREHLRNLEAQSRYRAAWLAMFVVIASVWGVVLYPMALLTTTLSNHWVKGLWLPRLLRNIYQIGDDYLATIMFLALFMIISVFGEFSMALYSGLSWKFIAFNILWVYFYMVILRATGVVYRVHKAQLF
jgi:hypothetical protein